MAVRPTEPTLVPLRLDSREQWDLHGVLDDRVEAWRRYPNGAPPPVETGRALGKLQSGSLLFTPEELRRTKEAIGAYRHRRPVSPAEERRLRRIVDRIDRAMATQHSASLG